MLRYPDGTARLVCDFCGYLGAPARPDNLEAMLIKALDHGWTLLDRKGRPVNLCPLCRNRGQQHHANED